MGASSALRRVLPRRETPRALPVALLAMAPPEADALTSALYDAMTASGGASQPGAEAQAPALLILDEYFPELLHFGDGASVAASPAAEVSDARGEYYRTTGAILALAACLAAAADPEKADKALELVRRGRGTRGPAQLAHPLGPSAGF